MKKLLFTIFTIVGLSTISIANNHLEIKKVQIKKSVIFNRCMDEQQATFDLYMSHGTSYYEAYFAGARAWGECMGG